MRLGGAGVVGVRYGADEELAFFFFAFGRFTMPASARTFSTPLRAESFSERAEMRTLTYALSSGTQSFLFCTLTLNLRVLWPVVRRPMPPFFFAIPRRMIEPPTWVPRPETWQARVMSELLGAGARVG